MKNDGDLSTVEHDYKIVNPVNVGSIDGRSFIRFRKQIDSRLEKNPNAPILIIIDSPGGEAYPMFGMIDYMEQVRKTAEVPIITYCLGRAMSAGFLLLSCGDHRYCSPSSILLFHEASIGLSGMTHTSDLAGEAKEMERLRILMYSTLAKNMKTKGGPKKAKELLVPESGEREIYITPERALEIGAIDKIGFPTIKAVTTYTLT